MEHVVQLGISIDDDAIQKQIMKTAEKTIIGEIKNDIESQIIERHRASWSYERSKDELSLTTRAEAIIREWLDENSDKIIELAGKMVAEKVFRSKKWKDKYSEVTAE